MRRERVRACKIKKGQPKNGWPRRRVIKCRTIREFNQRAQDLFNGRIRGPVEIVLP